jgi:hypothetical protein
MRRPGHLRRRRRHRIAHSRRWSAAAQACVRESQRPRRHALENHSDEAAQPPCSHGGSRVASTTIAACGTHCPMGANMTAASSRAARQKVQRSVGDTQAPRPLLVARVGAGRTRTYSWHGYGVRTAPWRLAAVPAPSQKPLPRPGRSGMCIQRLPCWPRCLDPPGAYKRLDVTEGRAGARAASKPSWFPRRRPPRVSGGRGRRDAWNGIRWDVRRPRASRTGLGVRLRVWGVGGGCRRAQ